MQVIRIPVGYANVFLLKNGQQSVLIDTGIKRHAKYILEKIGKHGLKADDIALIIQTHTHFDHAGNTAALKKLTGAKVLVHQKEADCLAKGYTPIPNGTNLYTQTVAALGRKIYPGIAAYAAVDPDIIIAEKFDLAPWGINGYVLPTPGHTEGSVSVFMEDRIAIAGDCFFPVYPKSVFTPFCNDIPLLLQTWQTIFDLKIDEIYAGHGPRFNRQRGLECLGRLQKRFQSRSV